MDQTLKLVSLRGRLMAESGDDSQGAMAAILKLEQAPVEEFTRKTASESGQTIIVANYNTPGQYVVSGHVNTFKILESLVNEAGGRFVRLPVSGAFHSSLMDEAAARLAAMMKKIEWRTPGLDVFFNSTAGPEKDPEKIRMIMQKQMTSPVYFMQMIKNMNADGSNRFIEIGPKGVLSRMVPQILGPHKDVPAINISGHEDWDKLEL